MNLYLKAVHKITQEDHLVVSLDFEHESLRLRSNRSGKIFQADMNDYTIIQSTGLVDSNHNDIFEGDFIQCDDLGESVQVGFFQGCFFVYDGDGSQEPENARVSLRDYIFNREVHITSRGANKPAEKPLRHERNALLIASGMNYGLLDPGPEFKELLTKAIQDSDLPGYGFSIYAPEVWTQGWIEATKDNQNYHYSLAELGVSKGQVEQSLSELSLHTSL